MRLFDRLTQIFGNLHPLPEEIGHAAAEPDAINPATGLPTLGGRAALTSSAIRRPMREGPKTYANACARPQRRAAA